jgi:hypothetical protein
MIERPRLVRAANAAAGLLAMAVILSGCASHPWEADIDPTAYACSQYGFYPGSKEWDDCLKFVEARRAKRLGF